jgi:glycolate oxidase FAD binding subunit
VSGVVHEPRSGDALAKILREHSAARRPLFVRGGGSRTGIANLTKSVPRAGEDATGQWLSTRGLAGIFELDAAEGVVQAGAGTPVAELAAAADDSGWELPLDPPGAGATLGGVLAAAAPGPRWPEPRAVVLGMGVVLATGERTRTGGRVVKNVTGYDLAKLHTGAFGSYGVIESAWLRLRPRPEQVLVLAAKLGDPETRFTLALAAARRFTARVAALRNDVLVLELAGDAPAVEADRSGCVAELGATEASPDEIRRVREFAGEARGADASPDALHVRVSVLPSALAGAVHVLEGIGAEVVAHPARGLVYARAPLPGAPPLPDAVAQVLSGALAAAVARIGFLRIEAAPDWVKRGRDVFGDSPATLPLLRALKAEFDPHGILNPGRFAGAL